MGILGSLLHAIPGVGTIADVAGAGLGILGAFKGAKKGGQADDLARQQLALQQQRYNEGAPYRAKLPSLLAAIPTQREDLSSIFADPGNPYARLAPRPMAQLPAGPNPITPSPQASLGGSGAPGGTLAALLGRRGALR